MLIASFLLFGLLTAIHFSGELGRSGLWVLRQAGLLPWPQVEFSGLLDDLYSRWPLDADEVALSTPGLAVQRATQPCRRASSLSFEPPEAVEAERRRAARYRDLCPPAGNELRVSLGEDVHRALLVDISSTGARLGQSKQSLPGTLLTLRYRHLRVPARVVWSSAGQMGVHFERPLGSADLNMLGA